MVPSSPISLESQPSLSIAIVGVALSAIAASYQLFLYFKLRTWFFWWIVLSALIYVVAFSLRAIWLSHADQKWLLYVSYVMFTCTPCLLAAACHATAGSILLCTIKPDESNRRAFLLPVGGIAPLFLGLDVASLGFQALGAVLICTGYITSAEITSHDVHVLQSGILILKWSLVVQLAYLGVYIVFILRFFTIYCGLRKGLEGTETFLGTLAGVTGISSGLIMLRGIYEVVELERVASGRKSLSAHRAWVYCVLDMLPIFIIQLAFSIVHPGRCLPQRLIHSDLEEHELHDHDSVGQSMHTLPLSAPLPGPVLDNDKPLPPVPSGSNPTEHWSSPALHSFKSPNISRPGPSSRGTEAFSEVGPYESKRSYQAYMSGGL